MRAGGGQLHEVGALQRRLGEEDAVVGDDGNGHAVHVGEPADEGVAVERLELVEQRAVDDACDHLAHVVGLAGVARDHAQQLRCVERRRLGVAVDGGRGSRPVEVADDLAGDAQRMLVVVGVVVGNAGDAGVHVGAAQLLGRHVLAGGGLHERRAAQEDGAGAVDDHALVAHGRDVGAAGGGGAHHDGDLGDAAGGHAGLVVEDAAEVVAVGEHLGLERQEGAAGVDQVDAGQGVLLGDLLRAQVLLDGDGVVGAALDGGVVGDDHAGQAGDGADAGDDAGARRLVVVEALAGQGRELEEGGAAVDQALDPLAGEQLAAGAMALDLGVAATGPHALEPAFQISNKFLHMLTVLAELVTTDVEMRVDARHPSGNLLRNAAPAARAGSAANPSRRPMRCLTPPTGRLAARAERV